MKRLIPHALIGLSLLVCYLGASLPTPVSAAPNGTQAAPGSGQALEIAPPVVTLKANPGQTVKVKINLRNVSSGDLIVSGQANDFVAAGEDGTPKILMDSASASNPYSLRKWVSPFPDMLLTPKQIKTLEVTLNVPQNASPGGHYGVIRFTATPPELKGTGVSLATSLGSLMLVTVNGHIQEKLVVQNFYAQHDNKISKLFESTPIEFVERIKNAGNVHEQPSGQVIISNMFGKKVAAVNINLPPRNVLPASTRQFNQSLDSSVIGNKRLFGLYHAELTLANKPGEKLVPVANLTFWVIPYRLIAAAIVLLVGGFFALRFMIKRYNRRIIAKAQGTHKQGTRKRRR